MIRYATIVLLFACASTAYAQRWSPTEPKIAVAVLVGSGTADAATYECCELRTRPWLAPIAAADDRVRIAGVDGRYFWSPRTTTYVQYEWSPERTWHFTFPRPASPPLPFDSYEAERSVWSRRSMFAAGQAMELVKAGWVRPWLSAGFVLGKISERQHEINLGFTDPSVRRESDIAWHRTHIGAVIGGGARFLLSDRFFVGGEVTRSVLSTQTCSDCEERSVSLGALEKPTLTAVRAMLGARF